MVFGTSLKHKLKDYTHSISLSPRFDFLAINMASNTGGVTTKNIGSQLTRHDFPSDFLWGGATSAYQVEGGYAEGGRSLSQWDVWSIQRPGKVADGNNGTVAIDHYGKFKEDVILMKKLGVESYRLSIAWSRILPGGRLSGGVNREGVQFYNDIIDLLLSQGIVPLVTIFHFDIPNCLEIEYGGFMSPLIVPDFAEYAEVCFFEFGDRVKHWLTMNEQWTYTNLGYITGTFPPGRGSTSTHPLETNALPHRCARNVDPTCRGGDAGTEPYIVAHNLLIAHAAAVDVYRRLFQAVQGGKIGITNMTTWYEPYDPNSPEDVAAAARAVDFMWGWFMAPINTGDYPATMRERVGDRLPKFTPEQVKLLKGSYDFIGMNYYTTNWAKNNPTPPGTHPTYTTDQEASFFTERNGERIGAASGSTWLFVVPYGIYKLLVHTKKTYNDPIIYITENGISELNDKTLSITQATNDTQRIGYYQDHFAYMKQAIDDGVKLQGYFLWSLFDNFEWAEGYTVRFGIYYVDYMNGLHRYPKKSAIWYMNFLNKKQLTGPKQRQVEAIEEDNTAAKRKRNR